MGRILAHVARRRRLEDVSDAGGGGVATGDQASAAGGSAARPGLRRARFPWSAASVGLRVGFGRRGVHIASEEFLKRMMEGKKVEVKVQGGHFAYAFD